MPMFVSRENILIYVTEKEVIIRAMNGSTAHVVRRAGSIEELDEICKSIFDAEAFYAADVVFGSCAQKWLEIDSNKNYSNTFFLSKTINIGGGKEILLGLEGCEFFDKVFEVLRQYKVCVISTVSVAVVVMHLLTTLKMKYDSGNVLIIATNPLSGIYFLHIIDGLPQESMSFPIGTVSLRESISNHVSTFLFRLGRNDVDIILISDADTAYEIETNPLSNRVRCLEYGKLAKMNGITINPQDGEAFFPLFIMKHYNEISRNFFEYHGYAKKALIMAPLLSSFAKFGFLVLACVVLYTLAIKVPQEKKVRRDLVSAYGNIEEVVDNLALDIKKIGDDSESSSAINKFYKIIDSDYEMHPIFKLLKLSSIKDSNMLVFKSFVWNKVNTDGVYKDSFSIALEASKYLEYDAIFSAYMSFVGKIVSEFSGYNVNSDRFEYMQYNDSDEIVTLNVKANIKDPQ